MTDWYERRHELRREQVFRLHDGDVVKLDRSVPGDGTKWYVAEWDDRHRNWSYFDFEIEPGDLKERRSEEHTSELQSLMRISYAVFCLKKKKQKYDGTCASRILTQNKLNKNTYNTKAH